MSQVVPKKNNGRIFPKLMDDFFNTDRFLMNFNGGIFRKNFFDMPEANIIENDKVYQIELAVPGMDSKDFDVEVSGGMLTISAEKEEESTTDEKNYRSQEFSYNSFMRCFTLPDNLNEDKIDAKYENGLLRLTLPKSKVTISKPAKHIKVS